MSGELLFDKKTIAEALQSSGHDVSTLMNAFMPRTVGK